MTMDRLNTVVIENSTFGYGPENLLMVAIGDIRDDDYLPLLQEDEFWDAVDAVYFDEWEDCDIASTSYDKDDYMDILERMSDVALHDDLDRLKCAYDYNGNIEDALDYYDDVQIIGQGTAEEVGEEYLDDIGMGIPMELSLYFNYESYMEDNFEYCDENSMWYYMG